MRSTLFPPVLLFALSGGTQDAQKALGNLLVQEVVAQFAQRFIEFCVAILRLWPRHRLGLVILGQRAISLECRGSLFSTSDHMGAMSLSTSDIVPQPACSDSMLGL